VGAGLIVVVSLAIGRPSAVTSALIGGACYFGFLFLVFMVAPSGMGFGDVRLSLLLGLYLGWTHVMMPAVGLLLACLIGIVLGLGVRFASRGEQRHFPFGPGLALCTLLAIAFHGPILERLLVG
jgi:prepilin signal peptidase PulO-like enzyme (type II secretory pathway)